MADRMTAEELVNAIREADSLEELQRLVGATEQEVELAKQRLEQLDALAPACKWDEMCPDYEAQQARERWDRIMKIQGEYESKYC